MLDQLQNQIFNLPSPRRAYQPDPDAHEHSPRHRNNMQDNVQSTFLLTPVVCQQYTGPVSMPPGSSYVTRPYWSQVSTALDNFIENGRYDTYGRRAAGSSPDDQSMPDYPHSLTPVSSRSVPNNQEFNSTASQMLTDGGIFDSPYHGPNGSIGSGWVSLSVQQTQSSEHLHFTAYLSMESLILNSLAP